MLGVVVAMSGVGMMGVVGVLRGGAVGGGRGSGLRVRRGLRLYHAGGRGLGCAVMRAAALAPSGVLGVRVAHAGVLGARVAPAGGGD
jgi:hypothetical protein